MVTEKDGILLLAFPSGLGFICPLELGVRGSEAGDHRAAGTRRLSRSTPILL